MQNVLIRKIDKAKEFKIKHDAQYYPGIQTTGDLKVMTGSGYDRPELFIFRSPMPMESALKSYFCQVFYCMVFETLKVNLVIL